MLKGLLYHKNILIISPEPWDFNHVSKHHYAKVLCERSNTVYFLNPPGFFFKVQQIQERLYSVNYRPMFRGLGKLPKWLSAWLTWIEYEVLSGRLKIKFDIIWNFETSRFFSLQNIKVLKIAHIVDLNQQFQLKRLINSVDICFCTTDFIAENLKKYHAKVFKIHHAWLPSRVKQEVKIQGNYQIKVGYVGNLLISYLDWQLLFKLAKKHESVGFYFIGPYEKNSLSEKKRYENQYFLKIQSLKNVYFLGSEPSHRIPLYLARFDILLITYRVKKYRDQLASPHKLMEYMASGKVTVATYTDEYKDKRHLLEMVETQEEFFAKFAAVVRHPEQYNTPHKQKARVNFAQQYTYTRQLNKIETFIVKNFYVFYFFTCSYCIFRLVF